MQSLISRATYRHSGLEGGGEGDLVCEHLTFGDVLGGKHNTLLRAALHNLFRACVAPHVRLSSTIE